MALGELSYWEWPRRQGCLRGKQFPWISHWRPSGCYVARTRSVPGVRGKWIPTYPTSTSLGTVLSAVFWLVSSRHVVSSTAGRVSGRDGHCLHPPPPLSSLWLHRGPGRSWLDWPVSGGVVITLNRGRKIICSVCYQNSDIMSSSHSSIDHTAG